jgi:ABC-type glycerol-3-phosphate transport system substrate-binding protein
MILVLLGMTLVSFVSAKGQDDAAPEVKTLRVWSWLFTQGEGPVLRSLIEDFDASREDIEVEIMETPWNQAHDQILLMSQTRDMPDLIGVNRTWLVEFDSLGILEDLSDNVASVPGLGDQFFEPVKGELNGKTLVLPYSGGNAALIYNKGLFDELGLQPPATIEEFVEVAEAISDPAANRFATQFCIAESNVAGANVCNLGPILYSFGAQYVENRKAAFNSPEGVAAIQWMIDLENNGLAAPGSITVDARGMREQLAGGAAAMTFDGAWGTPFYNNYPEVEIGIAPMPRGMNTGTVVNIANWGIPANGEKKEEAWALLSYLMEKENMLRLFREGNVMPTIPEFAEMPEFKSKYAGFLTTLAESDNYFQTGSLPQEGEMYRILVQAYQKAFLGTMSVQEALDEAAAEYNAILDEFYNS